MLFTLVAFVLVLSLLVFVHEMGHFLTARKFGVRAEEFGFGLPPRLCGLYKNKDGKWKFVFGSKLVDDASDTIFSLNWLPLGGFVNLNEDAASSDDPNSFVNQPIWKRSVILLSGVSMNVVLAMILISFGFMIGLPNTVSSGDKYAIVENKNIQVVEINENTPAKNAGFEVGDIVVDINGEVFSNIEDHQSFVSQNEGQELTYHLQRGNEIIEKKLVPEKFSVDNNEYVGAGIVIVETGTVKYPFFIAIWKGITTTIFFVWAILMAFYNLIKDLIMGHGLSADIAGPVGIAAITGRAARLGFAHILQFTAILSINLAIINALPFPALDGGRTLFLIIEKIKGSPVKRELEATIHMIGMMLLITLIILVTYKDIMKYAFVFKNVWNKFF